MLTKTTIEPIIPTQRLQALEESLRTGKPLPPTKVTSTTPSGSQEPAGRRSTTSSAGPASIAGSFTGTAAKPALASDPSETTQTLTQRPELRLVADIGSDSATRTTTLPPDASDFDRVKAALETRRKMFLVTALEGARHARLDGDEMYVEFAPETRHLRDTLAKSDNVNILREICREVTGKELGVRIVIKEQTPSNDAPLSREDEARLEQQRLRETAEKSPVVQQMLRTFRGEIVEVRRDDNKSPS